MCSQPKAKGLRIRFPSPLQGPWPLMTIPTPHVLSLIIRSGLVYTATSSLQGFPDPGSDLSLCSSYLSQSREQVNRSGVRGLLAVL